MLEAFNVTPWPAVSVLGALTVLASSTSPCVMTVSRDKYTPLVIDAVTSVLPRLKIVHGERPRVPPASSEKCAPPAVTAAPPAGPQWNIVRGGRPGAPQASPEPSDSVGVPLETIRST